MVSIAQLSYIVAVHRHGHFGAAARACGVSQPTLSAQIIKAEEELGVTIFARQNKPISMTEQGAAVVEQAQVVLAAHERMMRLAQGKFAERAGKLALGVIPTLAPYVVPWFINTFARRHPLIELWITELTTDDIVHKLRRQVLDVGLLATPLDERRIQERPLFEDPFYLYAAEDEPILERDEVAAEDLEGDRMWLLDEGHCFRTQTLALCNLNHDAGGAMETVRFEAGSFETLRNVVDTTEGYTLIPETDARLLSRQRRLAQVRPFKGVTPTRQIGLVHLRNTWKSDLIDALQAAIEDTLPRPFTQPRERTRVLPVR